MRVIAGRFRGRRLAAPFGLTTRPITDRVKETLFNILGHAFGAPGCLPPIDVLDVFAGTGGLGLEALSRGARACVFVERDRRALRCLRANITHVGAGDLCRVVTDNAWSMRPPETPGGFGLIFLDPPYRDTEAVLRVVDLLNRLGAVLAPDGRLVYRHETRSVLPVAEVTTLTCGDARTYARMELMFFEKKGTEGARDPGIKA